MECFRSSYGYPLLVRRPSAADVVALARHEACLLLLGSWLNSQLPLEMIACHRLDANQSHHTLLQARYSSSEHPTLQGPGPWEIVDANF